MLQDRQRKAARDARVQQKATAFAAARKLLPSRAAAAAKLDRALGDVAAAFRELEAADNAAFANWSDVLVSAHLFDYLRALGIESLSALRKQRPMASGIVRHLLERAPFDFATEVEKRNVELIVELEAPAIPEREDVA